MQYAWLEKWANEGLISQEARDRIYSDCRRIIKTAAVQDKSSFSAVQHEVRSLPLGKGMGPHVIAKRLLDNKHIGKDVGAFESMHKDLSKEEPFKNNKALFKRRYFELVALAPSTARDKEKARGILKKKMTTGFTEGDAMTFALLEATYQPKDTSKDSKASMTRYEKVAHKAGDDAAIHYQLCCLAVDFVQEKTAGAAKAVSALGPRLSGGAIKDIIRGPLLMAGIPLLAGAGMGAFREVMERRNQAQMQKRLEGSYARAMTLSREDERSVLHENPAAAREAFTALTSFAPHIAAEPLAAKAFMSRIVAYNQGIGMEDLKMMSEVERNVNQNGAIPRGFSAGFGQGTEAMGLSSLMKDTVKSTYQPFLNHTTARIQEGK